jgi:hypothetical protein
MRGSYYKWLDQKQGDGKRLSSSHCLNLTCSEGTRRATVTAVFFRKMPRIATISRL